MGNRCEHCGAAIVEYKHGLSRGLLICLNRIARAARPGTPIDLNTLGLNYNQQSNFQKLRYWELVEKADPSSLKGGEWILTERGAQFIGGDIALPHFAWTFRGEVVRYEGELITVDEIAEGYKYRPTYAKEAVPHEELPLFAEAR